MGVRRQESDTRLTVSVALSLGRFARFWNGSVSLIVAARAIHRIDD
jgi:hypothetical protein